MAPAAAAAAADGDGREEEGARDDDDDDEEDGPSLSLAPPDDPRVPTIAARSQAEASQASSTGRQPIYMYCAEQCVSFHTSSCFTPSDTPAGATSSWAGKEGTSTILTSCPISKGERCPTDRWIQSVMAASRVLPLSGFGYRPRAYVLLFRVRKWPDGAVRPPYDVPAGRLLVPGFVRCARSSPFPGTYRGKRPTSI